jgi:pimeloyl-ACP methyl ester carboxylesterase
VRVDRHNVKFVSLFASFGGKHHENLLFDNFECVSDIFRFRTRQECFKDFEAEPDRARTVRSGGRRAEFEGESLVRHLRGFRKPRGSQRSADNPENRRFSGDRREQSATEDAPYIAADFAKIRERRDLVFLDQRGTGGSHPLNCTFFNPADLQSYLEHWNPLEDVKKCRAELEKTSDLKLYTTTIAMDDLDEVRRALGYDKINITGGSYGTRAAQEYLRRHGKTVRAVHLHGVSLTNQFMPRDFPQGNERALEGVIGECLADEKCRAAFPNIKAETKAVLEKLLRGAVETEVKAAPDAKPTRVRLSRNLAAEAIRYMLYSTGGASRVPLFLHTAAEGNFAPLAEAAVYFRREIVGSGATGLYLSITCAEDLPWIKAGEGERNGENTFLGDYRLRQQREACALWAQGEIPADYAAPTRSNKPVLIMTGEWDPVTPPVYGETAAKNFPNGRHLVVKSGGHGFGGLEGLDCVTNLIAEFFEKADAKNLDTSCTQKIKRRGFELKFPEPDK